jgi:hypothetical protein
MRDTLQTVKRLKDAGFGMTGVLLAATLFG